MSCWTWGKGGWVGGRIGAYLPKTLPVTLVTRPSSQCASTEIRLR